MAIIKAGQIFVLTSGEWSDYRLDGVFRALKDIDPEKLCAPAIYPSLYEEQQHREPNMDELAAKLVREGFAEELTFTEWHRD